MRRWRVLIILWGVSSIALQGLILFELHRTAELTQQVAWAADTGQVNETLKNMRAELGSIREATPGAKTPIVTDDASSMARDVDMNAM
jgi:hypothetical protein